MCHAPRRDARRGAGVGRSTYPAGSIATRAPRGYGRGYTGGVAYPRYSCTRRRRRAARVPRRSYRRLPQIDGTRTQVPVLELPGTI